ncbi:hypothetical protein [Mesorhizobium prunaredense]|uniref:hypothetical protein n=1 Tax=Mesorhizobium prunaredense TaxID=1631249 RepID=UPI00117D07E6|nr:hypothetical protein [Mesorhizobium prunaredense]
MPAQIIIGDEHQLAEGHDDIAGRAVALSTAPLREAQLSMNAANPQWIRRTISEGSLLISATTSRMTVRTMRFLSPAFVVAAAHALRSAASAVT